METIKELNIFSELSRKYNNINIKKNIHKEILLINSNKNTNFNYSLFSDIDYEGKEFIPISTIK